MGLIPEYVTPAPGAAAPAGWVALYNLDCTAEGDWDFLGTPGPSAGPSYTDSLGATWDTADDTINGEGNASVLGFQDGVGLVITTSGAGNVSLGQQVADLVGAYDLKDYDRLLLVLDADSSGLTHNSDYVYLAVGDRDWTTNSHRAQRYYFAGDGVGLGLRDGGANYTSNVSSGPDALALLYSDQGARAYYRASYAAPLSSWTAIDSHGSWNPQPSTQSVRPLPTDAWLTANVARGGGTDITVTIRRIAVFGWAPAWR